MHAGKVIAVIIIYTYLVAIPGYSQSPISILSVQQGLPRSQIYDIVQDSSGYIWLGTRDGLVRFDGFEPEIYRFGNSDIPFNYTYDLFIDSRYRLWMSGNADYKGAAYLDLNSYEFHHFDKARFPGLSNNGIVAISESHNGEMVFLTKDFKLNLLDRNEEHVINWDLQKYLNPIFPQVIDVTRMLADPKLTDEYWICTIEGLLKFNTEKEQFTEIIPKQTWQPTSLFYDRRYPDELWVGLTSMGGLMKIDLNNRSQKTFYGLDTSFIFSDQLINPGSEVFSVIDICTKSENELYISTANRGIGVFDKQSGTFNFKSHHSTQLETDLVRAIFSNERREFWAGSDKNGLFYLRPENAELKLHLFPEINQFRSEFRMDDIEYLGKDKYLLSFYRHPEVWIWDRTNDSFDKIRFKNQVRYGSDIQPFGTSILLGSNQQLFKIDLLKKDLSSVPIPLPNSVTYINKIVPDDKGVWLEAWGYGIIHFDGTDVSLFPGSQDSQGLKHRWTHDIEIGPSGELWVGQENGLYRIDEKSKIVSIADRDDLKGFGNPNFKALTFDRKGRLWTGNFGGGIRCYDVKLDSIIGQVTVAEGMPSDRIYDLITDDEGFIWAWTSEGLCSFQPDNLINIQLKYYPNTRFLPVDRNGIWFKKVPEGEIFFGVSGGFVSFQPNLLRASTDAPPDPPIISGFKIFDKEVSIHHNPQEVREIKLKPWEDFFSISFSAPKSGFNSRQVFSYQLSGVDEDWVKSGNSRTANYTNVDPGRYRFSVKVMDHTNIWSSSSEPLFIVLPPPWYASNIAMICWSLLLITLAFLIYRLLLLREREKSQMALQRIEAKNLRELDTAKSNFFTQISHEFRTPLTLILGMTSDLKLRFEQEKYIAKAVKTIERNAILLLEQINQILELSKLRSKTVQLNWQYGNVTSYLEYLMEAFHEYASNREINLDFQSDPEEIWMDFDDQRLKEIFVNILSNAIKFSPSKSQIKVIASQKIKNNIPLLEIQFNDQGQGISKDHLPHIFEPYFQTEESGSAGTGLGLAIAWQWAQAMGGTITVSSQEELGTNFVVEIPISQNAARAHDFKPEMPAVHLDEPNVENIDQQFTRQELRVLVVEDNRDVREYIAHCLIDYEILQAGDGISGFQIALKEVPDLIITDIMMPNMDGFNLCKLIREHQITNHIPIIMLTAKADLHDKKAGLSVGTDAYITKPFDREELLIRIGNLLEQRRLLQRKYTDSPEFDPEVTQIQDQFLHSVQLFIDHQMSRDFTVTELAQHLGMSRIQLYRKIKALTDQSISQYIRFCRMNKARQLLKNQDMNISEVAYAVGFNDPGYFSKVFKETFHLSPSEFK